MRLLGSAVLLATAYALTSCSSDTTRPPLRNTRSYALESFDGKSLPTVFESDEITLTALSGSLVLDSTGNSRAVTHVHQNPVNLGPADFDTSIPGEYRFQGDSIEIGYFGSCRDLCIPNRYGTFTDSTVTLVDPIFMGTGAHTFLYRLVSVTPP